MSGDSFAFNFNINDFSDDSQDFPKSNVVELEGSKWYLGIEKAQSADDNCKHLNIFFACIRGNANGIYAANLVLILRSSLIDLLFTKTHYFEPLDLEMSCFKIDCGYIFDKDNGFINEDGGCEIKAEISVTYFVTQEEVEEIDPHYKGSRLPSKDHVGIINLQEGYRVHVNKKILSSCSEYFDNLFNNPHFDESSQESIDLTHFTYKQFRLLYKHMFQRRYRYLLEDGTMEFRLKSKEGVTEFKKLCNLTNLRDNYKARGYHRRMWHPDSETQESKRLLKEVIDMFDDVKQMGALLGSACCVSIPNVPGEKQSISAENVADLLCVGSYFQVTEILNGCKEFLGTNYDFADFIIERRVELAEKYSLNSITERSMDGDSRSSSHSNTEILVQVRFSDSWDNETCRVRYENFMTVQDLLIVALTNLYSDGICDCPSKYWPDKVRISELYNVSPVQIFHGENSGFKLLSVYISNTYSFEVRRKAEPAWRGQTRTEQDIHLTSKTIPFGHPSINEAYRKSRERKLIAKEESEQGHEPVAGPSGLNQTISQQIVSVSQLQDVRRSTSTNSNTILILVSFPQSQREEVCQVPYRNEMMVQQMTQRMFWELRRKSVNIARDYEVDIVRMFDPEFFAEPFNVAMQDLVRSETESTIYHVQLKRKEKVDDSTFRSTQKV